jgi:transcription initiation factor TFIIB
MYDRERGELVCTSCGLVIYDRMPAEGGGQRREEMEGGWIDLTRHDLGMGSEIGRVKVESPAALSRLRRMKLMHGRVKAWSWKDRSARAVMMEIDGLCRELSLPRSVRTEACVLYRRLLASKLTRGRDSRIVVPVLITLACRRIGLPRSEKEIVGAMVSRYGLEERTARRIFRRKELGVETETGVEDYLTRFLTQLRASHETSEATRRLLERSGARIRSRSPVSLSAALIYLGARISGEGLSVRRIAKVTGVSPSSISSGARFVEKLLARG